MAVPMTRLHRLAYTRAQEVPSRRSMMMADGTSSIVPATPAEAVTPRGINHLVINVRDIEGIAQILDRDPRLQAGRLLEAAQRQDALLQRRPRRPDEPPRHRAVREPEPAAAAGGVVGVRPAGRDQ